MGVTSKQQVNVVRFA